MLTFEQKLAIIESFPELQKKEVSLNRVNFHYEESFNDKKNVVYHLHPNGNGFVYAEKVKGVRTDDKGMVNIRDFSEEELRDVIEKSIVSLAPRLNQHEQNEQKGQIEVEQFEEEHWVDEENHTLLLVNEDEMWNVYAGDMLDGTFPSYNEAKQYLDEEGFRPRN